MSNVERTVKSDESELKSERASKRFNKGKRVLAGAGTAGLAALALTFALRNGSGEYDQATKDSLKASLRPTAVKIARGAIRDSMGFGNYREGNKIVINVFDEVHPVGKGPSSYPYTPIDVSAITGITNGRPDPKKVESVSISDGFGNDGKTVYIDSPQSNNLPNSFFTGGQDYSGHGAWSGSVIELNGQFGAARGFQANTDNEFIASENIDIFNPARSARIQTADMIAGMADRLYGRLHSQRPNLWPDFPQQLK